MVAFARQTYPGPAFATGSLTALDVPDGTFAGVLSLYALMYVPSAQLPVAATELARVLVPGGHLLVAYTERSADHVLAEWFGRPVGLATSALPLDAVTAALEDAGSTLLLTSPGQDAGPVPRRRAYLLAQRAGALQDG